MLDWFGDASALDLADGLFRITPAGAAISAIAIGHFLWSLYTRCWRHRVLVDYWHFVTGLGIIVPFFVFYPVSTALPNVISVGTALEDIRDAAGDAFVLNLVGYLAFLAGGAWQRRRAKAGEPGRVYGTVIERLERIVTDRTVGTRLLELSCLMGALMVTFGYAKFGAVFGVRDQLFQDPVTRALFNAWYSIYVVSFALGCLMLLQRRSTYLILLLLLSFASASSTGSRSMTLLPAIDVLITVLVVYRRSIKPHHVLAPLLALGVLAGITTQLRNAEQQESVADADVEIAAATLLYGNSLSDLRDLAWVLSAERQVDGALLGRTYLAAAMSFVPRSISEFREQYSLGTYTNDLLNLDSEVHPGVRGGRFLEPYLNFGWLGVLLIGGAAGAVLARTVILMAAQPPTARGVSRAFACILPFFLMSQLLISAGFWVVYVYAAVLLAAGSGVGSRSMEKRFA